MPPARMKEFPTVPVVVSTFNARREIHKAITGTGSRPAVLLYD
jgi:hypothetical protein